MSIESLLKLYLQMNLILLASYFLFAMAAKIASLFKLVLPHRPLIGWAQIAITASILFPIALHLVSDQHLKTVDLRFMHPAREELELRGAHTIRTMKSKPAETLASSSIAETPALMETFENVLIENWAQILFIFLSGGFIFCVARFGRNFLRLRSQLLESNVIREVGRVKISICDNVLVPFSAFVFRTKWIVLSENLLRNRLDFKLAIKHELQHHRQGDTYWAMIVEGFLCFFYLNPTIYLWKKQIIELQEFSCDEALVGQRRASIHDYGSCLVRVAETALGKRQMYVGTTCMAAVSKDPNYFKSFLRRRIEMLVEHKKSRARKWVATSLGTASIVLTFAVAYSGEQTFRPSNGGVNPGIVIVDDSIQEITERILADAIKEEKAVAGFAIVGDPNTGRVLAVANIDTKHKQTGHWALGLRMEAASIGKTLVIAEALDKNLTTPEETHACESGKYKYGSQIYRDWKKEGWKSLSTTETAMYSSDICSIKIGEKVGREGIIKMISKFGFGEGGTTQNFPEARAGQLPLDSDPQLIPYVSAGFGYKITPIEMFQAYGAIANGGNLMVPKSANESKIEVVRRVLSAEGATKTKEILRQVVLKGTGELAQSPYYSTAGKTASSFSADLMEWMNDKQKSDLAGFIGFAPVTNPKIEVYVVIHRPETGAELGAHGRTHAAPVFKRIVEEVLKKMNVPPDRPQS